MQLGPYRLLTRIGSGGMGDVWRAEDTKLLRQVAVKILSGKVAGDAEFKARFLREARTAAQLNHPNIATIYAADEHDGTMYIAMELVEGDSLSTLIRERRITRTNAVRIARQAADALAAAHEKGIIHRDVKPENIIVSARAVKVLDFGIAKVMSESAGLTEIGMILGTPHYMSPEQALGKPLDPRTDIFSLGVVMYEAFSGRLPFDAETVTATMMQTILQEPVDIAVAAPGLPAEIAAIVRKCMQKKADDRYQNVDEVALALALMRTDEMPLAAAPGSAASTPTVSLQSQNAPTTPTAAPPAPVASPFAPPPPAEAPRVPKAPTRTGRALIVDDDAVTRTLLAGALEDAGLAYDEATNGAEAIQKLKAGEYSMLFLDILMPRIDGWGVLDYIRAHHRKMKVFVMTGGREQRLSAVDAELVAGMIGKPFDRAQIGRVVNGALA